ncbi:hypothetical protein NCC78_09950 [Micromonospora phytophila]|uniref:hypothetical protein n=1 Tax=Micromonospora phytophila TaxID=709888 RepID=UPI00202E02BA|nr:hypothetical protein [Micromonospora phytophila]MCM0675009.1 hypothetical protein [Micromonospora phytophila]
MSRERFVVHLPVLAADLDAAKRFARAITRSLSFLPDVDPAETTVSEEDAQFVRHRVFCDSLLGDGRRCPRPADHDGACGLIACAGPGGC